MGLQPTDALEPVPLVLEPPRDGAEDAIHQGVLEVPADHPQKNTKHARDSNGVQNIEDHRVGLEGKKVASCYGTGFSV